MVASAIFFNPTNCDDVGLDDATTMPDIGEYPVKLTWLDPLLKTS